MANEFSPSVQIPTVASPDIAGAVMSGFREGTNAWQAHANNNAKQQYYENQLAQYNLRASQMQHENAMREAKFQWDKEKQDTQMKEFYDRLNWDKAKDIEAGKDRDRAQDNRDWAIQIRQTRLDNQDSLKRNEAEATAGFNQAASLLDSQPGTPPYERDILKLQSEWGKLPGTSAAIQTAAANLMRQANTVRDQNYRALKTDEQLFNDNIGQTLGGGNALLQNKNWYMSPKDLEDEKVGGYLGTSYGATPTGRKIIKDVNGNVLAKVDMGTINSFQQKRAELDARWKNMAAPINHPDIGVVPASGGVVTVRTSSGKQMPIYANKLQEAKERDPGLTVITDQQ
jgi:hypothetical protein